MSLAVLNTRWLSILLTDSDYVPLGSSGAFKGDMNIARQKIQVREHAVLPVGPQVKGRHIIVNPLHDHGGRMSVGLPDEYGYYWHVARQRYFSQSNQPTLIPYTSTTLFHCGRRGWCSKL